MKPKFQDYLIIAVALLAIFVSGYGIGYLFGERRTEQRMQKDASTTQIPEAPEAVATWQQSTLKRLQSILNLTPEQSQRIAVEIETTAVQFRELRSQALSETRAAILDLQTRMEQHLDERQKALIRKDKEALQEN